MRGALPMGENLILRNINVFARCPFCGNNESTLHLFFTCRKTCVAIRFFQTLLNPYRIDSFRDGIEQTKGLICLPPTGAGSGPLPPWILWKFWLARNQQIFENRHDNPHETLIQAINLAHEWQIAQIQYGQVLTKRSLEPAKEPHLDLITCQSDATWDVNSKIAGLGCIFSNRSSGLRRQFSSIATHTWSPIMAEALAIRLALKQATDLGFRKFSIASDSKQLIESINSECQLSSSTGFSTISWSFPLIFKLFAFKFNPCKKTEKLML